ncbi:Uncharacterised protein [Aedoeadaptatus ivorii]|uniref:Uncharacterized protein n=1 Tax=Aedoeadaptatus ivorii TaxID=54006 RepID=A0A3S4ZRM0_9FIRM|nr:hypothetical protein [Peptoniphilus ivorii]VEJ36270.1 Uncharacterised protein [Peptoniphilus ivorii]
MHTFDALELFSVIFAGIDSLTRIALLIVLILVIRKLLEKPKA